MLIRSGSGSLGSPASVSMQTGIYTLLLTQKLFSQDTPCITAALELKVEVPGTDTPRGAR